MFKIALANGRNWDANVTALRLLSSVIMCFGALCVAGVAPGAAQGLIRRDRQREIAIDDILYARPIPLG